MAKRKETETTDDDEDTNKQKEVVKSTSYFPVVEELGSNQRGSEKDPSNFVLSRQVLIREQNSDPEIRKLCQYALEKSKVPTVPRCYFFKQGVLMRKWRPPTAPASQEWSVVYQIVIPLIYHETVLSLAHDTPLAGYLGVNKTCGHLLKHFYWPGVCKDVKHFCRSCHTCQVLGKPNQKPKAIPLRPIPVAKKPFSHVIVDYVGPLPKTREGNQYLLTIMCTSTRFPEAVPLRNIRIPKTVKALIRFFTLFGLPRFVQSDQVSNFMCGIFQEVMFQLGVKQMKSSAYHPQSQGALERFHQTLKSMLRVYYFQRKKDWDEGIPLLLFAMREAIQTSLGFSPFELVFGHTPCGPLKLLKEVWLDEDQTKSYLTLVSDVHFKLQKANEFARENMKKAQCNMKTWYDKKTRTRSFKLGERVVVLLPLHRSPLQARFSVDHLLFWRKLMM